MNARSLEQLGLDSQRLLVDFLRADIALAVTMLETGDVTTHVNHAITMAKRAAETVRWLQKRVVDKDARQLIDEEVNKLEEAIERREA
jgi:hypothetical protein